MTPQYDQDGVRIFCGDVREVLPNLESGSVNCCVTSPPYWGLRDYGTATWEGGDSECDHEQGRPGAFSADGGMPGGRNRDGAAALTRWACGKCGAIRHDKQLGLEKTPEEYVSNMVEVFREVRRILRDDGTLWLNLGDSYASIGRSEIKASPKGTNGQNRKPVARNVVWGNDRHGNFSWSLPGGIKQKDLVGIPWAVAFALRADGWYLRSEIIWHKLNPMPESTKDRPTKSHEQIFLMSKSSRYYYNADAIAEPCVYPDDDRKARASEDQKRMPTDRTAGIRPRKKMKMPDGWDTGEGGHGTIHRNGREKGKADNAEMPQKKNKRTVWSVPTEPYPAAHFATFPRKLIEPCILAGCPEGGIVMDPFTGSGTTAEVARKNGCKFVGCEINPEYIELIKDRLQQRQLF